MEDSSLCNAVIVANCMTSISPNERKHASQILQKNKNNQPDRCIDLNPLIYLDAHNIMCSV